MALLKALIRLSLAGVAFVSCACSLPRSGLGDETTDSQADVSLGDTSIDVPLDVSPGSEDVVDAEAAPSSCADGIKDGNETDVDCGGPDCAPCPDGKGCLVPTDCVDSVCGADKKCAAPTCTDAVKNGMETDVDCGGPMCPKCLGSAKCLGNGDCVSTLCLATKLCQAPISCKTLLGARPGLANGAYQLDPDGTGPNLAFNAYCDMTTDAGGWTFFARANADYTGSTLFEGDVGTYRSDRADDGTTYGLGATILKYVGHTAMMITLDDPDPVKSAAASKHIGFTYAVSDPGFNKGPVPCSGLTTGFGYRTALTGSYTSGGVAHLCTGVEWYTRTAADSAYLTAFDGRLPKLGVYWGSGMGGTDAFGHSAYLYVR